MSTFSSASRVRLARVAPFDARAAGGGARASTPTSPVAAVGNRLSQRVALAGSALLAPQTRATAPRPRRSRRPLRTLALVNVDLGPAAVLGASVMTSAIALYQVRASRPEVSRDQDVFFSSVGLLCGGILVFQGWRLDPLMLFGQLLTAGTAVAFASEAIGLRQEILDRELADEEDVIAGRGGYGRGTNSGGRRGARDRPGGRGSRGGGGPGPGPGGAPFAPLPPPRSRMQFDQSYDDSSTNSSDRWDARRRGATPWGREQLGGDEFVYDAGSSYDVERRARRVGGEAPPRRGSSSGGETSGGGYMDGFQEGRGGAPGGGVRREGRDAPPAGSVGGGSKYDDSFGPGRFGDDNDDWEL
jgi:hypothetical protein